MRLVEHAVRNSVGANILMIAILGAGLFASMTMIRELLPYFEVDIVSIIVPYPGAGPEEVEEGVCLKLEDALEGLQGMKRYSTTAAEGVGTAFIEVFEGYDTQKVKDDATDRVNAITTFPDDTENPQITTIDPQYPVCNISLAGDLPERQLKELVEDVKDELVLLPGLSQVHVRGTRLYEIHIEVSEEKLRQYGLTFEEVERVVRTASLNLPGGTLRSDQEEIQVRTMGRRYTGREFADIVALTTPAGAVINLGQIATIRDAFSDEEVESRYNGRRAFLLEVRKTEEEDAIGISKTVDRYIAEKNRTLPPTVSLTKWSDTSVFIQDRIDLLARNGLLGFLLVILILWFFLDLRLAFWVALGIPISLAGGLALAASMGETINMITLFAMIMIVGIIVDDAIIVGEAIYTHRQSGQKPVESAIGGAVEVFWPVVAAVATTVAAFVPLLFVSGVMGKIVKSMPLIIIPSLAISLVECLIILPVHLAHLPEPYPDPATTPRWRRWWAHLRVVQRRLLDAAPSRAYRPVIGFLLTYRYVTLAASVAALFITVGMVQGGIIKYVFFPKLDQDMIFINVEFPDGTPFSTTRAAVERIERALSEINDELETASGAPPVVGQHAVIGAEVREDSSRRGRYLGAIIVEFLPTEERGIHYQNIIKELEKRVGRIPGVVSLTYAAPSGGPGGKDIAYWFTSHDIAALTDVAEEFKEELRTLTGVYEVQDDFRPGKREIRARLLPEGHTLGLTTADLARQLRYGFYGAEPVRVQRGRDEVKVRVRYPESERRSPRDVEGVRIRTLDGREIPLTAIADLSLEQGYAVIHRSDGMRRVAVTASVYPQMANAQEIRGQMEADVIPQLMRKHPSVQWSLEPQLAEQGESQTSMQTGFPLALLAIYVIICIIFRSYLQPIVIMSAIPFGIIGAVWGHLLLGYPVTFLSVLGMVALSGLVVNDAIVLIEAFNNRLARGMKYKEAMEEAGARRLRAVVLTSATTFAGLTPLILERSLQAQFLIPMAISIGFGIVAATVITLVLVPCLMMIVNDGRRLFRLTLRGQWPTREEVEPGAYRIVD